MDSLVDALAVMFPRIGFRPSTKFYWSPETTEVFYGEDGDPTTMGWSLLHETGHALLEHNSYKADFELIRLEVAAWERAKELASQLGLAIDENHVQDCIDTYRDWLYARSICPNCSNKSLQQNDMVHYHCFNCHTMWRVTPSRFCRAYRATTNTKKPSAVFQLTDGS